MCTVSTYTLSIISCATRRPECVTSPLVTGAGRTKTKRIYPMITIIVAGAEVSVYKGGGGVRTSPGGVPTKRPKREQMDHDG